MYQIYGTFPENRYVDKVTKKNKFNLHFTVVIHPRLENTMLFNKKSLNVELWYWLVK